MPETKREESGGKEEEPIERGEKKKISALSCFAVLDCSENSPQKVDALVLRLAKGALEMSKGVGFSSRQTFPRDVVSDHDKEKRERSQKRGRGQTFHAIEKVFNLVDVVDG